ncbi:5'/3'-nucleotidase SurE [Thermophagus xiamenensis]|jgi:5'-nucleotidase|uniref:5'-nucleotidase SurE n=1 Tax=Thermophagus xiamenensis TaxID=385682 RepID=A0A1I2AVT2_9BACT|nr:5'/3'-nucleotidase SurE [Thermophagus xiamenensis]SFE48061.1 5'-nucleotidase /3'-nucleotidase /exopolyphosphatase [Thermophagus xiamenensis]
MVEFEENHRPLILVTNDDGFDAKGLDVLGQIAGEYGNVVVVAPDEARSGMSNAITVKHPLFIKKISQQKNKIIFKTNGTPVDCVKLALNVLLPRKPDLILSGINHGSNSSSSVHYSGTLGGAREGVLNKIASVGFSLLDYSPEADFSAAQQFVRQIIDKVLQFGLPEETFLNVNIPKGNQLKGVKVCRQAKGKWGEEFVEREDPRKQKYYWLTGTFQNLEPNATDTDEYALANGFVSVVPCRLDITDHSAVDILKQQYSTNSYIKSKSKS